MALSNTVAAVIGGAIGAVLGFFAKKEVGAIVGGIAGGAVGYALNQFAAQGYQTLAPPGPLPGQATSLQATDTNLMKTLEGIPIVGNELATLLVSSPYKTGFNLGQTFQNANILGGPAITNLAPDLTSAFNTVGNAISTAGSDIGKAFSWL